MSRIRFHGRGGQAMKTASRIVVTAAFHEGYYAQDSYIYGAKRRGAPSTPILRYHGSTGPPSRRRYRPAAYRVLREEEDMTVKGVAKDIINPQVITVTDTMDLREVAKVLVEEGITGAPVVDEMGNLVGVISQSDLVEYDLSVEHELTVEAPFYRHPFDDALQPQRGFQIEELPADTVKDVMTPFLVTVEEDTPIREVASRMSKFAIHRLIVVDADQQIRGIVTSLDVLRWVAAQP
jgi:CBS domain-containing protein